MALCFTTADDVLLWFGPDLGSTVSFIYYVRYIHMSWFDRTTLEQCSYVYVCDGCVQRRLAKSAYKQQINKRA